MRRWQREGDRLVPASWFACLFLREASMPASGLPAPGLPVEEAGPAGGAPARDTPLARVLAIARDCSPRVEVAGPCAVLADAAGLTRLFGGPPALGRHLAEVAAARGTPVRVALAATRTAALLTAAVRPGVTVVPRGREAEALAPLPVATLLALEDPVPRPVSGARRRRGLAGGRHYRMAPGPVPADLAAGPALDPLLDTLARWGVDTLGDLAALPPADLLERLGQAGLRWRQRARGEDDRPLVRHEDEEPFEQHFDLDWPIEGLEPLSFVLARLLDPLCAQLARRDRGAAVVHVWLALVDKRVHHRRLALPVPMRDPKVLRTLVLLDLEAHPPAAGIDRVRLAAEPAPGRIVQHSLLHRPLPAPDKVSTLVARLGALMGAGRCGAPRLVDSHRPGALGLTPFAPEAHGPPPEPHGADAATLERGRVRADPAALLRRRRWPAPIQVTVEGGRPVRIAGRQAGITGTTILEASGPWRTSGEWWREAGHGPARPGRAPRPWDRDEWDIAVAGGVYRVFRDRLTDGWFLAGVWD
jgi:protein ImuB